MAYTVGAGRETVPALTGAVTMFYRNSGLATSTQEPYRYTRSADGRETWTPRQSYGPKTEMVARFDGQCRLPECGDRTIVGGETTIAKRNGQWNHKVCPKATTRVTVPAAARIQAEQDDREMAEMEAAADRAEAVRAAQAEIARDEALSQMVTATACKEYDAGTEAAVAWEKAEAEIADAADQLMDRYEAAIDAQLEETRREHGAGGTMSRAQLREVWNEQAKRRLNSPNGGKTEEQLASEADALLAAYETEQETEAEAARAAAHSEFMSRKLIYRVHLTGEAKRYGIDYVNVEAVPNAKYNNVKVGEFRGQGVGFVRQDGTIRYWNDVNPEDARVKAVVAAVNVLMNAADPIEFAKAYATESKECMRCGDDLVDDQNNPYYPLLGPVCGKKFNRGE